MRRGILSIVGRRITACGRVRCRRRPIAVEPGPAAFRKRIVGKKIAINTPEGVKASGNRGE
jgi:hypothetical protein